MPNPKPAPLNFNPDDPTGATWALPEGAIARIGKGYYQQRESEIGISPDGTYLVIGTRMGLWWYDMSSMLPIALWETEQGMISAVDISPDGKLIAFYNWDGIIKVRDIQSGECITQINRSEIDKTNGHITFSPNNSWIAIVNRGGIVEILDVQSGECISQIEQESNDGKVYHISKLQFSPDGQYIAATIGKQTYLWNPKTGSTITKFTGWCFAFSPDSRLIACEFNDSIKTFNILHEGGMLVVNWNHNDNVYKVIKVCNAEVIPIAEFTPPMQLGNDTFAFSAERIAFAGKGGIYLWDLKHSKVPRQLTGHTKTVWSLAFSPNGKRLVSGSSERTVRIWDVDRGEEIATIPLKKYLFPMALAYSPCGKMIAGGVFHELNIWCAEKLTLLCSIPQPEDSIRPFALTFSPCGRYIASGTWWQKGMEKMAIRLWDVATGENLHTFWGHTSDVEILTFSPDGTILASGSFDGTALLWDLTPFIDV